MRMIAVTSRAQEIAMVERGDGTEERVIERF